jgi:hypothetical protein
MTKIQKFLDWLKVEQYVIDQYYNLSESMEKELPRLLSYGIDEASPCFSDIALIIYIKSKIKKIKFL